MNAKVNDELQKQLEEAEKADPEQEIPVIVTLATDADPAVLEQKGVKIQRTFENIPAVAMILTASQVNEVAQLDQVERIEFDGAGVWPL